MKLDISRSSIQLISCFLAAFLLAGPALGQIQVLSQGDPVSAWRTAQLQSLKSQFADPKIPNDLKLELTAQIDWLTQWQPGRLASSSFEFPADTTKTLIGPEPTIDPSGNAGKLRERLLGPQSRPTARDTDQLRTALQKSGNDVGLRQLHLHWLDQPPFREFYREEIIRSCDTLVQMLSRLQQSIQVKSATAYAIFRRSRARLGSDIESAAQAKNYGALRSDYEEIAKLVGAERGEFGLLEMVLSYSDGWYGRSLVVLEQSSSSLSSLEFLHLRLQLLKNLRWEGPIAEAQRIVDLQKPRNQQAAKTPPIKSQ